MSFQDNKMLIMPAVDIKNGKCVQLVQGEPGTEQVIIENPETVARKWEDMGAEVVHVIDLHHSTWWRHKKHWICRRVAQP